MTYIIHYDVIVKRIPHSTRDKLVNSLVNLIQSSLLNYLFLVIEYIEW